MRSSWGLAILCVALCGGCSLEPQTQPPGLLIATAPPGAACLLTRQGQTIASVGPTPAIARGVDVGDGSVTVACRRPGFAETVVSLPGTGAFSANPEQVDVALVPLPAPPLLPTPR